MTYNLRFASATPPHAWPQRRPLMAALLDRAQPDLIGTQEGLFAQLKDLATDLPDYGWVGLGREGGSHGEFMAIFYRRKRFEPLEFDHFWLSDTPAVMGSRSWGNHNVRMVTWVRFRDLQTDQVFYHVNTHLDHEVQAARENGAKLILERLAKFDPALRVILTGDFNAAAGHNAAYDLLTAPGALADTWTTAAARGPLVASFHGYHAPRAEDDRIDWILTRGQVTTERIDILTEGDGVNSPSDHFPVLARLQF